jgi:hypothetical protein
MTELLLNLKDFYWAHRAGFLLSAIGVVLLAFQGLILLWTMRRLQELSNIRERMSRLADGLALLTDTTEAGLSTIAKQLEMQNGKAKGVRAASRVSVARRVAEAVRKGDRVTRIAEREALSESEVSLHLALVDRDRANADPDPAPLAS